MPELPALEAPDFASVRKESGIYTENGLRTAWNSLQERISRLASQVRNRQQTVMLTTVATGTQNNFDISGANGLDLLLRCNNASLLTITGMSGGFPGQRVTVIPINAEVDLTHLAAGSAAGNKLLNQVASGPTRLISTIDDTTQRGFATYIYDSSTTQWRLIGHDQGGWARAAFSAGDFTGSGSMTWTVEAADVFDMSFKLDGRSLFISAVINGTSIGGTPSNQLIVSNAQWGGYTVANVGSGFFRAVAVIFNNSGSAPETGEFQVAAGATSFNVIRAIPTINANWTASTNLTGFHGQ